MAKKQQSTRSRAARRATTPDLDTAPSNGTTMSNNDSGLDGKTRVQQKVAELSVRSNFDSDEVLARAKTLGSGSSGVLGSAGISKGTSIKKLKRGAATTKQLKRKMQAFDKAASFVEVQDVKRSKSFGRLKIIDERRKTWEEVNVKVDTKATVADIALPIAPKKSTNKFAALLADDSEDEEVKEAENEDDWEDEDL